ncbi:hypothetical protein EYD45_10080 [Hyunsoonleella flava]|uniref:Uncharacterized protein n=1 Tax=Hyunsoonleella flava TaxID=2527939 RepID=A0A4Q9FCN6_9FLAO|nr:hypothetical protein [Hyunsoonleella flava]TBN03345.1 hypothetical protein EYD45_10080 [Hyunsoonleella flava]
MKYSVFIFFFWISLSFAQAKNEKEERIPLSEFPKIAQNYFNSFSHKVKYLKFYRETDGEKQSFEAKFKIKKLYYSVEFDTEGKLEDVEIVIKEKYIPKSTFSEISGYFDANYRKTRLLKIQKQYVNYTNRSDKAFLQHIVEHPNDRHTHFEIIAEIKTDDLHELREFTFDKNGKFEAYRKVTSSSYEHALY